MLTWSSDWIGHSLFCLATLLTTVAEFQEYIWHNFRERRKRQSLPGHQQEVDEWMAGCQKPTISYLSLLKLRYAWGCREKQLSHSHSSQPHRLLSCSCCVSKDISCTSFSFCDQVSWEPSHEDICGFTKKEKKAVVGQVVIHKATMTKYPTLPRMGGFPGNTELQCQNQNGSAQIKIAGHLSKASIWKWHIYWCSHSTGQKRSRDQGCHQWGKHL